MNREIEFRGQCVLNGEWLYGDLEYSRKDKDIVRIHTYNDDGNYKQQCLVVPDTVGQFTGLKDNHGNKVFEGDIVEVTSMRYGYEDFMKKMLCEIVYDNDFCCFDFLASDRKRFMCTTIADVEIEVIGNIYDNPELLNKK